MGVAYRNIRIVKDEKFSMPQRLHLFELLFIIRKAGY